MLMSVVFCYCILNFFRKVRLLGALSSRYVGVRKRVRPYNWVYCMQPCISVRGCFHDLNLMKSTLYHCVKNNKRVTGCTKLLLSNHIKSIVNNFTLHFCKRLFLRLEPVTLCTTATTLIIV